MQEQGKVGLPRFCMHSMIGKDVKDIRRRSEPGRAAQPEQF